MRSGSSTVRCKSSIRANPPVSAPREQAIMLGFDHSVTLTNVSFQSLPVKNLDVTAHVTNESLVLQARSSMGNTFAPHAQHIRNEFLSHFQFV